MALVTIVVDDPRIDAMPENERVELLEIEMAENGLRPGTMGVRLVSVALGDAPVAA